MGYNSKAEETVLTQLKPDSNNPILVKKLVSKDSVKVDIRTHFFTEENEIKPTQKGVRFNAEEAVDLIKALSDVLEADEIEDLRDFFKAKTDEEEQDTDEPEADTDEEEASEENNSNFMGVE